MVHIVLVILYFYFYFSEGRKHDSGMLADSGLLQQLSQYAFSSTGDPMCLYGDPAYPLRIHLQAPFRNAVLTPQMHFFNESMSSVRESVEWLFADIVNYFKFLDFKKNLKLQLSAVGKFYIVAAILRNALTCMYFNETSKFFGLEPPTLQEYFSWDFIMRSLISFVPSQFFFEFNGFFKPVYLK